MALTPEWYRAKADALAEGWRRRFGTVPAKHTVELALAPAILETRAGDAWPGEFNWGATTLRSLNAAERKVLADAGIAPTVGPGHTEIAARAQSALVAAGLAPTNGVIHCDSYPGRGAYFVYFFRGQDDADGAAYFVKLLAEGKPARAVLENPKGTEQQLAAAMYARGYYAGFHTHATPEGNQANIDSYASGLRKITPGIRAALKDWAPAGVDVPPPSASPEPFSLTSAEGIWRALGALGFVRPLGKPFSEKRYLASLGFFQGAMVKPGHDQDEAIEPSELLTVDGDPGPETLAALKRELERIGLEVR